jgi:hypothetical protein
LQHLAPVHGTLTPPGIWAAVYLCNPDARQHHGVDARGMCALSDPACASAPCLTLARPSNRIQKTVFICAYTARGLSS